MQHNEPQTKAVTLTQTLTTAFIALSLISLLIASIFQVWLNFRAQQEIVARRQQVIALDAAEEVVRFIEQSYIALETTARVGRPMVLGAADQEVLLKHLLGGQTSFREVSLLAIEGHELAKQSRLISVSESDLGSYAGSDLLREVGQKKRYISSVYVDQTIHEPFVRLAVPIYNSLGDFEGALTAEIKLKFMWDLVAGLQIGETGQAYVVDELGNLIALQDATRVLKQESVKHLDPVADFLAGGDVVAVEPAFVTRGIDNNQILATYVPLHVPNWAVVAEVPLAEAYQTVLFNVMISAGGALLVALLAGMGGVVLARRLATPLRNLTETATRVAEGELNLKASLVGTREIVQLGGAFNSMTSQLKELIDTLEARVASRTYRLALVATLGERVNAILEVQSVLAEVVNELKNSFNFYHAHIYLLDETGNYLIMAEGTGQAGVEMKAAQHRLKLDSASLVAQAARTGQAVSVADVQNSPHWLPNPLLPDTRSEMAVPIMQGERVVGVLDVQSDKVAGLDEGDANLLRSLAGQVAVAMTNARLFAQTQQALQETETLYTISRRMVVADNLAELIKAVMEEAAIEGLNRAVLFTFEYEADRVVAIVCQANWSSGQGHAPTPVGVRYERESIPILKLFITETPVLFNNMQHDDRVDVATLAIAQRLNILAMAVLPLWNQGQQLGVLLLEGESPHEFSEREIRPYQAMLGQLAVAVENQQLLQQTIWARERAEVARGEAEEAKLKADQANQAKSGFLSNMSHELRTPLNGILGYAQILKRDKNLTTKQLDGLEIIQQSGEHLLTLINDILDLAKIEAGKMELVFAPFHLDSFLDAVIGIVAIRAQQKGLTFEYEPATDLPRSIEGDEKRLRQILLNLLNNAVKFTEHGQVVLQVSTVLSEQKGLATIRFEVRDTGVGMTAAQLERLFKPFEQVGDKAKRAEGTGLGLAISWQLVTAMGAVLQVDSEMGVGSRFWFDLVVKVVEDNEGYNLNKDRLLIRGYQGARRRILVVDDKGSNRGMLVNLLEPLGFEIEVAENGQQGVDLVQSWQPNLILMDMVMPVMTGFEATQVIRNLPGLGHIPIIGTSASAFEKDIENAKIAGCDGFLAKPIKVSELLDVLQSILDLEWLYDLPVVEATPVEVEAETPMPWLVPAQNVLQSWMALAKVGDILVIEEEAEAWRQQDERYGPFIAELTQHTSNLDMDGVIEFINRHLVK